VAAVLLGAGAAAGSVPLLVAGVLVAAVVGLRLAQVVRRRMRVIDVDLAAFSAWGSARDWSVDELASWPSLATRVVPPAGPAAAGGPPATPAARRGPVPLLDRWHVTQVLWAGVVGWLCNLLADLAERLVEGTSCGRMRRRLLAVTATCLAALSAQSVRRTVVISVLATASTTGLVMTAAGAAEGTPGTLGAPGAPGTSGTLGAPGTSGTLGAPGTSGVARTMAAVSAGTTYTVVPGDTLWAIAERFGTTVGALVALNHIADPNLIYPGQVLVVGGTPAPAGSAPAPAPATSAGSAPAPAPAGTPAPVPAPAPAGPPTSGPPGVGAYENPLRALRNLTPERIDQGVDYAGSGPVYAIGDGVVLNTANAGWPGGAFISYRLSSGPAAGDVVYVAENVVPAVQVGQQVTPATVVGTLVDASPDMEIGWSSSTGAGESAARAAGQWSTYDDSSSIPTVYGENFSQLLSALGAPAGVSEAPAQGSLPAGWPSW
jgi:LysM repeat protein